MTNGYALGVIEAWQDRYAESALAASAILRATRAAAEDGADVSSAARYSLFEPIECRETGDRSLQATFDDLKPCDLEAFAHLVNDGYRVCIRPVAALGGNAWEVQVHPPYGG